MNSEIDFTASLDCEALFSSKNQLKLTSYSPFPVIDFIGGKPRFPNLEEKLFELFVKIGCQDRCQDQLSRLWSLHHLAHLVCQFLA